MSMPRNRNGHVSNAVKLALMAGTLPLVASQSVLAQEGEEAVELEEITVTGSRIPAQNLISSSPVTTVSREEIAFQGVTRVEPHFDPGTRSNYGKRVRDNCRGLQEHY